MQREKTNCIVNKHDKKWGWQSHNDHIKPWSRNYWLRSVQIVRVPCGWTWIRLIKFFSLQILVAQVVLIENSLDDIASPLGISSNMLIKAAITRNPFLPNIGGSEHARAMKIVSIPRFSRWRNHMRPFLGSWDDCIITYSIWPPPWRVC